MSTTNISVQNSFTQSCLDDILSNGEAQTEGLFTSFLHATAVNGNKNLLQKLLQEVAGRNDEINRGDQFGRTPLVYSVLGDRLDCAELLIKNGASVHMSDVDGRTPLHWAAYQGNHKCVKLLLSKGADWRAKDTKGRTPLHFAASPHSAKCLSVLLKKAPKGEVDDPDNDSMTALHWGASYGNTEHVKMLLKAKASVKLLDVEKKTPLHWGATNPNPGVVKLVLEQSNEIINWQDIEGRTALHHAVAQQNEAVVKTLLAVENCNVSVQDNIYRAPLHWAAVLGNPRIVKLLLRKNANHSLPDGNGATALHYAAQGDYFKTVEVFLSFRGVNDIADNEGRTALMWAARKGASVALETILCYDLDVHATDNSGRTALHVAAYSGDIKCVEKLLNHGASVNALDEINHTPLFRACEMGYIDVVNVLMKHKAALALEDQDGRSPLHWAALNGHAHICQTLIQHGVPSNKGDRLGCTPLHCAAYGGFVNCMSVLIEGGADVNKLDREGISPLHWSCSSGHLEAVKLLLRNRAFPNFMKKDAERLTPLDFAIFGDHQDVAQYMIEQGGLTITAIQDVAATTIQSCWRGYCVRKPFQTRKGLYMRHEQLKRDMLLKRRGSCAVRDDDVRAEKIALMNTLGSITAEPELSSLPQDLSIYKKDLPQRNSKDMESEDSDYFLTSLAIQRYSFSEYQNEEEDPNQLSTILESPLTHSMSNPDDVSFSKIVKEGPYEHDEDVREDGSEKMFDEENGTSDESLDLNEKLCESAESLKVEEENLKMTINSKVDVNVPETTAVPSNVHSNNDIDSSDCNSNGVEKINQKYTKYHSNINSRTFSPRVQLSKNHEIIIENDIPSSAKLITLQSKSELARKDRERRNQIRVKMEAASKIQSWYRRYRERKFKKSSENDLVLEEVIKDQRELVEQVAALTIQLGWRKYLGQKYQTSSTERAERQLNNVVHSDSLRSNADSTKGTVTASKPSKSRNKASEVRRPTLGSLANRRARLNSKLQTSYGSMGRLRKTALFSPVAASCNFALDMQNPIVAKRGNTRTSTPRRGANNKIRPSTSRRKTTSAWTPSEGIQGRKSQR